MYLNLDTLSVKFFSNIILLIFLQQLCMLNRIDAQLVKNIHIDPIGLNSLGGSYSNFDYMFDWNLGEVFTKPISNANNLLITPGFLQSFDMEVIIKSNLDTVTKTDTLQKYIKTYPNPVVNNLYIQLLQLNLKILSINLLDQNGNSLALYDEQFNTQVHFSKIIPMGVYAPNLYLLSIRYVLKGNYYRTMIFKIIKI